MGTIHAGATLTPHFRDFLPPWLARQPWYEGTDVPSLTAVGFLRLEDPAGQVGIETHLVSDGTTVYQLPMTYRGEPAGDTALIRTAEHSVLGPRWIYDAPADPLWQERMRNLVRTNGTTDSSRGSVTQARGHLVTPFAGDATLDLQRTPLQGVPTADPDVAGFVTADIDGVSGCLAVIRVAFVQDGRGTHA
jgi:hypothetical protein